MISFATSAGRDSIGTWLVGSSMVFAFIVPANFRSRSGGIIRSLAATAYQVGFVFHAALVSFAPKAAPQIPATSPESDAFSKDLKHRGFSFVGPTVVYAYMQAVGMVNDHVVDCFRYREIRQEQ